MENIVDSMHCYKIIQNNLASNPQIFKANRNHFLVIKI